LILEALVKPPEDEGDGMGEKIDARSNNSGTIPPFKWGLVWGLGLASIPVGMALETE
jgi:hypothetical protein